MRSAIRIEKDSFYRESLGASASASDLANALQRLEEQTRWMLRQCEEGAPMAYCGCLTELSMPAENSGSDELSLLFDQAEVTDDVPEVMHVVVCAEEVRAINKSSCHACMGDEFVYRAMNTTPMQISDEEVEAVGYLGWASNGNMQHM